MPRELQIQVTPEIASNPDLLKEHLAKLMQVSSKEIKQFFIVKRSIDARQKAIKFNLKLNVFFKMKKLLKKKLNSQSIKMYRILKK